MPKPGGDPRDDDWRCRVCYRWHRHETQQCPGCKTRPPQSRYTRKALKEMRLAYNNGLGYRKFGQKKVPKFKSHKDYIDSYYVYDTNDELCHKEGEPWDDPPEF